MSENKIRVGITIGDPNGIGCEVILKTLADSRLTELFVPVVYGSAKIFSHYRKASPGAENIQYTVVASAADAKARRVNLVNCVNEELKIEPGMATKEAGKAAVDSLRRATDELKSGLLDVIVTAPFNKETVQSDEFRYVGHTEFFADEFGGTPVMMMCSELFKIGLVTMHVPISGVSQAISKDRIIGQLERLRSSLIQDFGIVEPRIAVLALNPHAGDGGLLGMEEIETIKPAIEQASKQGILAFGPFPADGFFASATYNRYDAVLAMYHDQGLSPFKALTPQGVNFSAGLSAIRTSPDHGVAYDIAGHGVADPSSMREAIYMAMDIYRNRKRFHEMTANPLRRYERDRGADMSVNDLPPEPED